MLFTITLYYFVKFVRFIFLNAKYMRL